VRLSKVAKHHRAKGVVLAEWKKADKLAVFWLKEKNWKHVAPADIFG
jgi:hypothetical protein